MAYKQYTHCIEKSDFDSFWNFGGKQQGPVVPLAVWAILQGIKDALIGAVAGFLVGGAIGAGIGASIGFSYGVVDGFCDQWLNRRLICISKDVCAIGKVAWQEAPKKKDETERIFDNDASFNLRLIPYDGQEFGREDQAPKRDWNAIVADGFPAAKLVGRAFSDLNYGGYEPDKFPDHPGGRWTLHCEFEGNAMVTLCTIAKALAILGPLLSGLGAVAGAVAGALYGGIKAGEATWKACKKACSVPIFCDIVCAIATAVAAVVGAIVGAIIGAILGAIPGLGPIVIGTLIGTFVNTDGSFADAANDPASGNIDDEDCVFVAGDHVYDAGHKEGWHEIHPVKHLQKICSVSQPDGPECCPHALTTNLNDSAFKPSVQLFWDRWCKQFITSRDPIVVQAQQDPENQWCIHPLIDGCTPRQEPPPIIG